MKPSARDADGLATWLAWLGIPGCKCQWAWKGLGILYGVSFGNGWVRLDDSPACLHHPGVAS